MNVQSLIESEEGRRHEAYRDTLGVWTIGIGHTGPEVHEGLTWSDDLIDRTFAQDVCRAMDGLCAGLPWFAEFEDTEPIRSAYVISMAFQLGVKGTLGFHNTLQALREKRWADAGAGVRKSMWYSQTPRRAERCARAFETGDWQIG